jgi:FkbM family methyltransferase
LPLLPDRPGIFIEAGANDGIKQSNTHGLEFVLGWHGLLIEPVPSLASACRRNRPRSTVVNTALVSPELDGQLIEMVDLGLMTTVAMHRTENELRHHVAEAATTGVTPNSLEVVGQPFSRVIDEAQLSEIDFLSLDVEGFELVALAGLDLSRHSPRVVMVETDNPAAITALLGSMYVGPAAVSHHDFVWVRHDWLPSCQPCPLKSTLHGLV